MVCTSVCACVDRVAHVWLMYLSITLILVSLTSIGFGIYFHCVDKEETKILQQFAWYTKLLIGAGVAMLAISALGFFGSKIHHHLELRRVVLFPFFISNLMLFSFFVIALVAGTFFKDHHIFEGWVKITCESEPKLCTKVGDKEPTTATIAADASIIESIGTLRSVLEVESEKKPAAEHNVVGGEDEEDKHDDAVEKEPAETSTTITSTSTSASTNIATLVDEDESGHRELLPELTKVMNLLLGSLTVIGYSGVGLTMLNLITTYIVVTTQPKEEDSLAESSGGAGIGLPTWTSGRYVA